MRTYSRKLILTRDTGLGEEGKAYSCTGQRVFYYNSVTGTDDKDELEEETTFFFKKAKLLQGSLIFQNCMNGGEK